MFWTADALRIGEVLVDGPFKRFQQFLFKTRFRPPVLKDGRPHPSPLFLWENPTTGNRCR